MKIRSMIIRILLALFLSTATAVAGGWSPAPSGSAPAPMGPQGDPGCSVLATTGAPSPSLGNVCDWAFDANAGAVYGPKPISGVWGPPVVMTPVLQAQALASQTLGSQNAAAASATAASASASTASAQAANAASSAAVALTQASSATSAASAAAASASSAGTSATSAASSASAAATSATSAAASASSAGAAVSSLLAGSNSWSGLNAHTASHAATYIPTTDFLQVYAYGGSTTNTILVESDMTSPSGSGPAISAACRTKNIGSGGGMCAAVNAWAFNDNTAFPSGAWAFYDEHRHFPGAGASVTNELEITEFGTSPTTDPYAMSYGGGTMSAGLYVQSGGGCGAGTYLCYDPVTGTSHYSAQPASVAIAIGNNNAPFRRGLQFNYNALLGNDGMTSGQFANAIIMPMNDAIGWFYCTNTASYPSNCAASTQGVFLYSTVNTSAAVQKLIFSNTGMALSNSANLVMFDVAVASTYVDGLIVQPGVSGSGAVTIEATGADANVNLAFLPQGSGKNVFSGGMQDAALSTGTPAASLCLDSSGNFIKKTTTGSCI